MTFKQHSGNHGRSRRKLFGAVTVAAVLTLALVAAFIPTASAIVKPGDISQADWDAVFNGSWPPKTANTPEGTPLPGTWPLPATNPNLTPRCGIDIGVIIDRSGSIADAGQGDNYKAGVNALIDAFAGTPSKMGLWSFANNASDTNATTYPWHQMVDLNVPANVTTLHTTANSIPIVSGFSTNYEEGLRAPLQAATQSSPLPDLWIVLTDGQPTVHANDGNTGDTTNNDDMAGGIQSANLLKAVDVNPGGGPVGTKVFGVGVGGATAAGLALISGPTSYNGSNFTTADYLTTSFADLEEELEDFALSLCGSSVTVTKQVSTTANPDSYSAASGWTFGADNPDNSPEPTPASDQTDGNGEVVFSMSNTGTETMTITETQQAGYALKSVTCGGYAFQQNGNAITVSLPQGTHVSCTFQNQPQFVDLEVEKSDGGITTSPGGVIDYTIDYANNGTAGATGVVLKETVPANTTFTGAGWTCAPDNNAGSACTQSIGALAAGADGSTSFQVTVNNPLPAGVTEILNTVLIDDDICEVSCDSDDEDTPLDAAPLLEVLKDDGGVSVEAGDELTYTIQYRNVGDEEATDVELVETVPADTTFVDDGPGGWECDDVVAGSECTYAVGDLPVGDAYQEVEFTVLVDEDIASDVEEILNTVVITDDECEGVCDEDDEDTPVEPTVVQGEVIVPRAPAEQLPATGQDINRLLAIAGILLILGGAAVIVSPATTRRRRH